MSEDLYADPEVCQAILMDYYRHPRCAGTCEAATHAAEARNPACGDLVVLSFAVAGGQIESARARGAGCALSQASASLLAEHLEGKSLAQARQVLQALGALWEGRAAGGEHLGQLAALRLMAGNPVRARCAAVAREAAAAALGGLI